MENAESEQTLELTDVWASRVRGGAPEIELTELTHLSSKPKSGTGISLSDTAGNKIGFGIVDRENKLLRTYAAEATEKLDFPFFRRRLRHAIALRKRAGLLGSDKACRLVNAEGDNLPGFTVDFYAGHVLIQTMSPGFAEYTKILAELLIAEVAPISIVEKVRLPGEPQTGQVPFTVLHGEEPSKNIVVSEDGLKYEVHMIGGLNTGLFCDMREVRQHLRPWLRKQRVLNTFSYTSSFSVVAASEGAKSVTSVDFASGVLNWAKANFELNGLDPLDNKYRFVRADVFEFFKNERRKEKTWDVIILDPPSSTSVPGRRWYQKTDYHRLIGHALEALEPGGLLVAASSAHQSRPEQIETHLRTAAKDHNRRLQLLRAVGLPIDFPTPMIHPQSRYLKCYFVIAE